MWQSFEDFWRDTWRNSSLFPIEAGVILVLLAALAWRRKPLCPRAWWSVYLRLAARQRLSVLLVFIFTIVGHYAAEPSYVAPVPGIHDEFSYLLAADTFLSGRLANPPHPMRYFFETFHVLMEPSYVSMYPPGQGFALALGILLTGSAIGAVWLTAAGMAAAVCWMLQQWMRPHWALTGGLICAVRIGWFSYWANSFWGGAVAAAGGALAAGALPRLIRKPSSRDAALFAFGLFVLANTRPFEGAAFALAAVAYLAIHGRRHSLNNWLPAIRTSAFIAFTGLAFMTYYNWRCTGAPLVSPYLENRSQYQIHGSFYWSKSTPSRTYNHDVMHRFYNVHEEYPKRRYNFGRWPDKPLRFWAFFVGPALTLVIVGSWVCFRTVAGRFALTMLGTLFAAHLAVVWDMFPHYAAPFVGAFYLLLMESLRGLTVVWRRRMVPGAVLARVVLCSCAFMAPLRSLAPAMGLPVFGESTQTWYNYGRTCNFPRSAIEKRLASLGGRHLILVQYDPQHPPEMEWVYNRADIDAASVVWARYVSRPDLLARLLAYYHDRHVWIIFPDRSPNQLFDYKELSR